MPEGDRIAKIDSFNIHAESWAWPTRCDGALEFVSPVLREAIAVWRDKAGSNPWASRADMTPRAMKNFLPHVVIIEVARLLDRTRYRLRLTGSWVDQRIIVASGQFLDEVIPEPHLERWQSVLGLVLNIEGPIRTFTNGIQFGNKEYLDAEDFLAPLGNPGEPASAILAVITSRPREVVTGVNARSALV